MLLKNPFDRWQGSTAFLLNPLDCRMIQNGDPLVYMLYMLGFV